MRRLFGGILLAVGVLLAGACGICSLAVLLSGPSGSSPDGSMLGLVLLFGGPPVALGIMMIVGGLRMVRQTEAAAMGSDNNAGVDA